jgi:ABC-type amino acid transport substrate-binding protein
MLISKIVILFLCFFISVSSAFTEETEIKKVNVVIVFTGGPSEKKVEKYIGQFADIIAGHMSLDQNEVNGHYFTDYDTALTYLEKNQDAFIISSLGFYLSRRRALGLVPLAAVELAAGPGGRYYLVAKKGTFGTLEELKGKTISGNTLYEDSVFLSRIVFNNQFDILSNFTLKRTSRPLSAIRKMMKGKIDCILLDEVQYRSLQSLPFFDDIVVVYTSPRLPEVGLMMVDAPSTRKLKEKLLAALTAMGGTEDGAGAFNSFGLKGFKRIDPSSLDEVIRRYEGTD